MKKLAGLGLLIAVAAVLLIGCGSSSSSSTQGLTGAWESTGGSKLVLQVDAPTDGKYPVTFVGGDIERKLSATQVSDTLYRAEGKTDVWVFRMVDDDLMNVTITPASGSSATTTFKRTGNE